MPVDCSYRIGCEKVRILTRLRIVISRLDHQFVFQLFLIDSDSGERVDPSIVRLSFVLVFDKEDGEGSYEFGRAFGCEEVSDREA